MGSIKISALALPLAIAALAASPAVATMPSDAARFKNATTREYSQASLKDYSKNGATGDYAPAIEGAPSPTAAVKHPQDEPFAWAAAGAGAGVTLVLVMAYSLTTRQVRRRRLGTPASA